jgi:hypothetical protein
MRAIFKLYKHHYELMPEMDALGVEYEEWENHSGHYELRIILNDDDATKGVLIDIGVDYVIIDEYDYLILWD